MLEIGFSTICSTHIENLKSDSIEELFQELSRRVALSITKNSMMGKRSSVVLTGGRHSTALVSILVSKLNTMTSPLKNEVEIVFWLSDERFIERNSSERNDLVILDNLRFLDNKIHWRLETYLGPELVSQSRSCSDYAQRIDTFLEDNHFDFVILSHALDGHLASIFTKEDAGANSSVICSVYDKSISPLRLSLTFRTLARTQNLFLFTAADSKEKKNFLKCSTSLVCQLISTVKSNLTDTSVSYFELTD